MARASRLCVSSVRVSRSSVSVRWGDAHTSHFHHRWLRDHCPQSLHPSSQQRTRCAYPQAPSPPKHESMRSAVLRVRPSAVMGTRVIHTRTSAVIHPLIAHPSLCATHKALATGAGTQEALAIVRAPHRPSQSLHVCDRFDSTDAESNHELCSHLPPQFRPPPPWPSHHPKTLKSFIKIY